MKRSYSICIFYVLLVCISFSIIGITGYVKKNEEYMDEIEAETTYVTEEEAAIYSSKSLEEYNYVVFDVDGHVTVFYSDNESIYFDTGILSENLPESIKNDLQFGLRFLTEQDLYEFLENYSS